MKRVFRSTSFGVARHHLQQARYPLESFFLIGWYPSGQNAPHFLDGFTGNDVRLIRPAWFLQLQRVGHLTRSFCSRPAPPRG